MLEIIFILQIFSAVKCATTVATTNSLPSGDPSLDWLIYLVGSIFGALGLLIIGMVAFIFYKRHQIKIYEEIIRLQPKEKLKEPTVICEEESEDKPKTAGIKLIKPGNKKNKIHSIEHLPTYCTIKPLWYTLDPQIHKVSDFRQIKDTKNISIVAYDTPHITYMEEISLS